MNEAGGFQASPPSDSCNDSNDHQYMMNALMMQHHHHEQFAAAAATAGGFNMNCDYRSAAAAAAPSGCATTPAPLPPCLQSPGDHPFGSRLIVNGALAPSPVGAFPLLGGGLGGALAGAIPAGPVHSNCGSGVPTYVNCPPACMSTSSAGSMLPSQNGSVVRIGSATAHASSITNSTSSACPPTTPSRYESQKRRDWNTFGQYLRNSRPPLAVTGCNGEHVLQFLRYLDQFGKTKVHSPRCPYFGHPHPPGNCECPLRQAWGSLDALIGRLRAAFEEHGGRPETNPFGARPVRLYLREVRELQAKARGIAYEKKKRKRPKPSVASSTSSTDTNSSFHLAPPPPSSSSTSSSTCSFLVSGCN